MWRDDAGWIAHVGGEDLFDVFGVFRAEGHGFEYERLHGHVVRSREGVVDVHYSVAPGHGNFGVCSKDDVSFFGCRGDVFDLVVGVEGGEGEGGVAEGGDGHTKDASARSLDVAISHVVSLHLG